MKYIVDYGSKFKSEYKRLKKRGKDLDKLHAVIEKLANKENLDSKYMNHKLSDDKIYNGCYDCHIEPNWILIYKYNEKDKRLILYATGSHNDLFKNKY